MKILTYKNRFPLDPDVTATYRICYSKFSCYFNRTWKYTIDDMNYRFHFDLDEDYDLCILYMLTE